MHVGCDPVHAPPDWHVLKLVDDDDNIYPELQKRSTVAPAIVDEPTTFPFGMAGKGEHVEAEKNK